MVPAPKPRDRSSATLRGAGLRALGSGVPARTRRGSDPPPRRLDLLSNRGRLGPSPAYDTGTLRELSRSVAEGTLQIHSDGAMAVDLGDPTAAEKLGLVHLDRYGTTVHSLHERDVIITTRTAWAFAPVEALDA